MELCMRLAINGTISIWEDVDMEVKMARKYITRKSIQDFTFPKKLPSHYEDEILDAFADYSRDTDMVANQLPQFFQDLRIPAMFMIGNKRIRSDELIIEGTQVVDFDKLLLKSYQLLLFRDHRQYIEESWRLLQQSAGKSHKSALNVSDLKKLDTELKTSINDALLLDMIAVGTEGTGLDITITDFAYILGKLGLLTES